MWDHSASKGTSAPNTSPEKNASDSSGNIAAEKPLNDDIYQPRLQCRSLLEGVDEKIRAIKLLEAEVAKPSPSHRSSNIQEKIKKLDQCLQTAYQIAQILQQIPVMLQDIAHSSSTNPNEDDDSPAAPRSDETEVVEIQNNTQAKKVISDAITQRIIHNLMSLLEARMNEIKSETIAADTIAQESTSSKTNTKEPIVPNTQPGPRSTATIREEKLKSFFQQKFSGNYTFIHLAVLTGNPTMLQLALHYGVSPYEKDNFKNHAIHYALRKPAMLLIFIEQSIQNNKPLNLADFYHNGSTLEAFVGLKQKKVEPLEKEGYEILKDYHKASMSRNKEAFCVIARTYFDSLAKHDDATQELAIFSRRTNLSPQETLRYSVLMTMPLINQITKPYQQLINQLLFNGKVALEDFTLPDTIKPEDDRDSILGHFQKHCGQWADNRGEAIEERKQLHSVVISHVRFIDFIANFQAMHVAITKRFPSWKNDLHANLQQMCSHALVALGETRLTALLPFLTSQYQQLESATMQNYYQKRMTAILLAETPQRGEGYFTQFTASINQVINDNNIDDDGSFRDCYSDDDEDSSERTVPIKISIPSLLSLQKLKADVLYILRFLTHAQRLAAVEQWVKNIAIHRKEESSDSINDDESDGAAASANKENAQETSHLSQVKAALLKFPGLISLKLGGSATSSAAGSPRFTSTTNSLRATSTTGSPRAVSTTSSPRPSATSSPRNSSWSTMPNPYRTTTPGVSTKPGENTTPGESPSSSNNAASAQPGDPTPTSAIATTIRSNAPVSRRNTIHLSTPVSASSASPTHTARLNLSGRLPTSAIEDSATLNVTDTPPPSASKNMSKLNLSGMRALHTTAKQTRNDLQQDGSPMITPRMLAKQQSHSPPATPRAVKKLEKANSYSYRSVCDVIFKSTPATDPTAATTATEATTSTTAMTATAKPSTTTAMTSTTMTANDNPVATTMSMATSLTSVTVIATQAAKTSVVKSSLVESTIPDRHSIYGEYISDTSNHTSVNLENADSGDLDDAHHPTGNDHAYQPILRSHSSLRLGSSSGSSSSPNSDADSRSNSPTGKLGQLDQPDQVTGDPPKYNTLPRLTS